MKMRILLYVCVAIVVPGGTTSITEDPVRECDSDYECLPSTDCQYYQEQTSLIKSLTNRTLRSKLIKKWKKLICNKNQRGICCPKTFDPEECGKPQLPPSNVRFCICQFVCFVPTAIQNYALESNILIS